MSFERKQKHGLLIIRFRPPIEVNSNSYVNFGYPAYSIEINTKKPLLNSIKKEHTIVYK